VNNKPFGDTDYPQHNWMGNIMTYNLNQMNTNLDYIRTNAYLGPYTARSVGIYKCPLDLKLSPNGPRIRSVSMNAFVGPNSSGNPGFPGWLHYLKLASFRHPTETFVFVDENPDTINDGWMIFCPSSGPGSSSFGDQPASITHAGTCAFSFADGHAAIHKWSALVIANSAPDIRWVTDHATEQQ